MGLVCCLIIFVSVTVNYQSVLSYTIMRTTEDLMDIKWARAG